MWRGILAVLAGLAAWAIVVTVLNFGLRWGIPGYHAAEATLDFTLTMKIARLVMAAITSLAAGAIVAAIAPARRWAAWVAGVIVLALFLPSHVELWDRFPPWYHLSFLVPLVPLFAIGATLWPVRRNATV